jgi:hypothetical protein
MKKGTQVEITINAGLCKPDNDAAFVGTCPPGTMGTYLGKHPNKRLKGWHLVQVGELVAPLGPSQFQVSGDLTALKAEGGR